MGDWILLDPINLDPEVSNFAPITLFQENVESLPWEDQILLVDYHYFLDDLYQSFHYDFENMIKLFYIDVPREDLVINQKHYKDPKKAYQIIDSLKIPTKNKHLIYMLATQCSMVLPCKILVDAYCPQNASIPNYLAETREGEALKIEIEINHSKGYVNVQKMMRIFYLEGHGDDVTKYYIEININFNLTEQQYVVLSWKLNKK